MDEQLRIILIIIVSVSIFGLLVFVYVKNYIKNKINQLVEDEKKKKSTSDIKNTCKTTNKQDKTKDTKKTNDTKKTKQTKKTNETKETKKTKKTSKETKKSNANVNININVNVKDKDNTNNIFIFTGEIIHKYFELIIKNQLDIDFILGKKLSYIEALFTNQRFSNSEIKLGLGTLNQSLQHLQKKEVGKWIYKQHIEDYLESRYIFIDELGSKRTLIPDRSFVDNGIRWLIDYKTVFNETNLKSHAGLYKSQLDTYAKIFNDNYPIKKAIYFCKDGELICVD